MGASCPCDGRDDPGHRDAVGLAWRDLGNRVQLPLSGRRAVHDARLLLRSDATLPAERATVVSLDEHFFKHRIAIIGGVLFANVR